MTHEKISISESVSNQYYKFLLQLLNDFLCTEFSTACLLTNAIIYFSDRIDSSSIAKNDPFVTHINEENIDTNLVKMLNLFYCDFINNHTL